MHLMGFVYPTDPMWLSTLKAMNGELVSDSLVYRYNPSALPDGLRGHEGTFSLCTFHYVDALARPLRGCPRPRRPAHRGGADVPEDVQLRQPPRSVLRGDRPHRRATRELPQAFSHLALIGAAIDLDYQLEYGPGNVQAARFRSLISGMLEILRSGA